jgi:hypothetical protein
MNEDNVFVNCPFDNQYYPLLKALLFTLIYIGFKPQISETTDSGEARLRKIRHLMLKSKYCIRDLAMTAWKSGFEKNCSIGLREELSANDHLRVWK